MTKVIHACCLPCKEEADSFGIPYIRKGFWPPYYITWEESNLPKLTEKAPTVESVVRDLYNARVGDVARVFKTVDGGYYLYKVTSITRASGDDHIVSPLKFDIQYVGKLSRPYADD